MSDAFPDGLGEPPTSKPATGFLPSPYRRSILFFCAATFFYWTALYFYVPILPVYARSAGASLSMVGIIIASYALPQFLFRVPLGVYFDALSRRKPQVAAGIIMAAVGALGLGLAHTPWLLALARAATGLGASAWVIFTVYFTAYYPQEGMGRAIGAMNFVNSTAIVVATAVGGVVAEVWGFKPTFFAAVLLGLVSLLALLFTGEPASQRAEPTSWHSFTRVATSPVLLIASSMGILLYFVNFAGVFGFIPLYGARIGASSVGLGIITMLAVASSALASLVAISLAERWGNLAATVLGSALMGSATLAVPFITRVYVLAAVQVANGIGKGILTTILMTMSIKAVAPQQRATAMGVYQAVYSAGMLTGPLVSGFIADGLSLAAVFYLSSSLCLVIAGMAFLPVLRRG